MTSLAFAWSVVPPHLLVLFGDQFCVASCQFFSPLLDIISAITLVSRSSPPLGLFLHLLLLRVVLVVQRHSSLVVLPVALAMCEFPISL
jgi:hypothetical protein